MDSDSDNQLLDSKRLKNLDSNVANSQGNNVTSKTGHLKQKQVLEIFSVMGRAKDIILDGNNSDD